MGKAFLPTKVPLRIQRRNQEYEPTVKCGTVGSGSGSVLSLRDLYHVWFCHNQAEGQ
jgi:hypothetical protein